MPKVEAKVVVVVVLLVVVGAVANHETAGLPHRQSRFLVTTASIPHVSHSSPAYAYAIAAVAHSTQ